jgi:putative flippase GtrA
MLENKIRWEALSFAFVGVFNTLVTLTIIYALKASLGFHDVLANAVGYFVGVLVSFGLNARWTFAYQGPMFAGFWRFIVVTAAAYIANLATVTIGIYWVGIDSYLAHALGVGPYAVVGFIGAKFFAFAAER